MLLNKHMNKYLIICRVRNISLMLRIVKSYSRGQNTYNVVVLFFHLITGFVLPNTGILSQTDG